MIEFPRWFPREYLALAGLALWLMIMTAFAFIPEWIYNRQQRREARRALTAAPESRPKSSE